MTMRTFIKTITIAGFVMVLCGCLPRRSGVGDAGPPGRPVRGEPAPELFTPSSYIARPTVGLGSKYRDLLSPDSYCIWFTDEVAELKQESATEEGEVSADSEELLAIARTLNEKYIILEFHLVSAFSDSSIAYDITSFRHAEVFLLDGAGNKYEPLQVIVGTLEKGQKGALMVFRRVNLLVFPKHDLLTGQPVIASSVGEVSLVLSGYNTTYFLMWGDVNNATRPVKTQRSLESVRTMTLERLESALRFLSENLQ
jgi:hypothetical protein